MTEERDAELLLWPQPQSWPACSYFLWALARLANHFHGWFKEHVPNLELLTQGREQATWQIPWALNDSTNSKPRPSSPQVVLRFVNLLAMLARTGPGNQRFMVLSEVWNFNQKDFIFAKNIMHHQKRHIELSFRFTEFQDASDDTLQNNKFHPLWWGVCECQKWKKSGQFQQLLSLMGKCYNHFRSSTLWKETIAFYFNCKMALKIYKFQPQNILSGSTRYDGCCCDIQYGL
jgi:hypothetical protein